MSMFSTQVHQRRNRTHIDDTFVGLDASNPDVTQGVVLFVSPYPVF